MRRLMLLSIVSVLAAGCGDSPRTICAPCVVVAPRLLTIPQWIVPGSILDTHATTAVRVLVTIDSTGAPSGVQALDQVAILDSVAVDAVARSTWAPGTVGGHAVTAVDTLTLFGCSHPEVGDFVYYEEEPVRISIPPPQYPDSARDAGIEGTVKIQVLLGVDGSVWCSQIVKSIPALDGAALDAAWHSLWRPAMNNHGPVIVWVEIPITFALNAPPALAARTKR